MPATQTNTNRPRREPLAKEARFFKLSPDLLCIAGADGYFKHLNPAWEKTLGFTRKELLAKPYIEFVHPEDRAIAAAEANKLHKGAETICIESRYLCADGSYKRLEWTCNSLAEGLIYAVVREIAAPQQASEALLQTRERLQHLLGASPAVIYSCHPCGDSFRVSFISDSIKSQMGWEPREFLEDPGFWASRLHPEDAPRVFAALSQLMETGFDCQEYRFRHRDGQYRWMRDEVRVVRDAGGNVLELVGCWRDITDRVGAAQVAARAQEALKESEQRYQTLAEVSPVGIFHTDAAGCCLYVNRRWCEIAGLSPEGALGDGWVLAIHPDDRERVFAQWAQAAKDNLPFKLEYRFQHPDGATTWVLGQAVAHRGKTGEIAGYVGTITDLTVRVRMEEALRQANETLELRVAERTAELNQLVEQLHAEIRQRQQAEESLHKKQEFLKTLLNNLADGIVACDENGVLTLFNRATREFHGLPEKSIPAERWADYYNLYRADGKTPMQREDIPLFRALQGETVRDAEMAIVPKKGKARTLLASGQAIVDERGNQLGAVITMHDITARKEAEAALRESESRLNSILHSLKDVVWSVTPATLEVLFLNPAAEKLYGRPLCEFFDNPNLWLEAIHPADRDRAAENSRKVMQKGSGEIEYRIVRPTGEVRYVHCRSWLIYGPTGNPIRLDGIITDITRRVRAEKTQARLTAILEATPDLVGISDAVGNILYINKAGRQMVGIGDDADVKPLTVRDFLPASEVKRLLHQAVPVAVEKGVWRGETALLRRGGRTVPVSLLLMSHKSENGEVEFLSTIIRDISEQKLAEEERSQLIASLQESEAKLAEAQKVAHVGWWEIDLERVAATWSEEHCRIFGLEPSGEPLNYESYLQRLHPDDVGVFVKASSEAITLGKPFEFDQRIFLPDGSLKYIFCKGQPIFNREGKVVKIFGTTLDISDRVRSEEAQRRSEERYRALAQNFPNGSVALFDRDLRYTLADGAELGAIGKSKEQMEGKTIWEVWPPETCEQIEPVFRAALTGTTSVFELTYADKTYWVQVLPVTDRQGKISAGMLVVQNISARKRAEEALQQSEARFRQLAQREALLNQLAGQIRNSLDVSTVLEIAVREIRCLLAVDRCCFIWYNFGAGQPVWEVAKEARRPDLPSFVGQHPVQLTPAVERLLKMEIISADDLSTATDPVLQELYSVWRYTAMLSLPAVRRSNEIGLVCCGHHTGCREWSESEVELLKAVSDQLAIALCQAELYSRARDSAQLAEEKAGQLEVTLRKLQETQAQLIQTEKMSGLGQLVAGVAHEINNPVNFIHGNITYLSDYAQDLLALAALYQKRCLNPDPEIQAALEEIDLDFIAEDMPKILSSMKVGTERIRQIVLSLRTFSRLDEAEMKAVDIHEGLESTLLILQNRLKAKPGCPEIEVVKEYGNLPEVECCAGSLNQVFMNVLANAIDALEIGHRAPSPTIRIRTEVGHRAAGTEDRARGIEQNNQSKIQNPKSEIPSAQFARIVIADNGPGMTEEVRRRLFDPFFTTKPVGKGTGLGLSISYQIVVEKHGGVLTCESQPGQGTEFWIQIPIRQPQPSNGIGMPAELI